MAKMIEFYIPEKYRSHPRNGFRRSDVGKCWSSVPGYKNRHNQQICKRLGTN